MIDHLVYATPDLEMSVKALEQDWGVPPSPGGQHPGRGTHNALLDLGDGAYLELIGPDPAQPEPKHPRGFGVDGIAVPRLVTWAASAPGIEGRVRRCKARGHDPGAAFSMSRQTSTGNTLHWKLTSPDGLEGDGIVPFLIDWGQTDHPSESAAQGCRLVSFTAEHPDPPRVRALLEAVEVELRVEEGPHASLLARIATPHGAKELR